MAESASPARWKFVLYHDSGEQEVYPLTKPVTSVGRDPDNDIQIDDLHISRHHLRLTQQADQLLIEDLGTANGTLVNGGELTEPYPLQVGDTITLGSFTFLLEGQSFPYRQSQETRRVARVAPPPQSPTDSQGWLWVVLATMVIGIVLVGVLGFLALRLLRPSLLSVAQATTTLTPSSPSTPAIIVSQSPALDTEVQINHSLMVQAIVSDPAGVERVELWVNGQEVDQITSSLSQNAPSMTAAFQWAPETPGTYTLEIRAYNQPGRVSQVVITTVAAVTPSVPTLSATETPLPSPTATPVPPTETPLPTPTIAPTSTSTPLPATPTPVIAQLQIEVPALNVRSGPGTDYNILGVVDQRSRPEIMGQADAGQGRWWLIRFEGSPDGFGWVSGDPFYSSALNSTNIPQVSPPRLAVVASLTPTTAPTSVPTLIPTATELPVAVIRPPEGKMLLIVSNRSQEGVPARLTLSGGRSVGGGQEIDPPANGQIELVLDPDFYRALWSSPARNFTRGVDFTAIPGKVMVMWIVPEDGVTQSEMIDEMVTGSESPSAAPAATPAAISPPAEPVIPSGKALLIVENRSIDNEFAYLTMSEGSFGGGYALTVDAGTQHTFEIIPARYRTTWSAPAGGGMSMNREFTVKAGEIVHAWVVPEKREVVIEVAGQRIN